MEIKFQIPNSVTSGGAAGWSTLKKLIQPLPRAKRSNGSSTIPKTGHINPRYRAYGKARLDTIQRSNTQEEWELSWKEPAHTFPLRWAAGWRFSLEYRVDDFAAEIGFLTDILGLPVNLCTPDFFRFITPSGDFCLGVAAASETEPATPPGALRIQFSITRLTETYEELQSRGIVFETPLQPIQEGSTQSIASFRTPHGISIDLFGDIAPKEVSRSRKPREAVTNGEV